MKLRFLLFVALINLSALCPAWGSLNKIEDQQASSSVVMSYSLKTLPYDPLADILSYLPVPSLSCLWETGDKKMQKRLIDNFIVLELSRKDFVLDLTRVSNVDKLDVPHHRMPPIITLLTQLKVLGLYSCGLTGLSPHLTRLSNLIELNVVDNQFPNGTLPKEITLLTQLKVLGLCSCGLTGLPNELSRLSHLTELSVSSRRFINGTLPEVVTSLQQLKTLDIYGVRTTFSNGITNCSNLIFPHNFSQLSSLTTLTLDSHQLENSFLSDQLPLLTSLITLRINGCGLRELPVGLSALTNLSELDASNNEFSSDSLVSLVPLLSLNHLIKVNIEPTSLKKSQLLEQLHPYAHIITGIDWES